MAGLRHRKGPFGRLTATVPAAKPGTPLWRIQGWLADAHIAIFRRTKGRLLGNFDGAPLCVLISEGAKSGKRRESPIIYLAAAMQSPQMRERQS